MNTNDNPALRAAIIAEIEAAPAYRITFARFMAMALYQPGEGYYTHRGGLIGGRGDFYTAPHLTPAFGQFIAKQVAEFWRALGEPADFQVVEGGAGQGLVAGDILTTLRQNEPVLWATLRYTIDELSPTLQKAQEKRLLALPGGDALRAKTSWRVLSDFAPGEITGCYLSNELVDAFPVHLVTVAGGELREIFVSYDATQDAFIEQSGPLSNPDLAKYFRDIQVDITSYAENYRTEVNLQAASWLQKVARALGQGFVLTIDYGYPASGRYNPRRAAGTLQCYTGHTVHDNPYINIGRQDITSHVDFTALERTGAAAGLTNLSFTRQMYFLAGLGIGERLAGLTSAGLEPRALFAEREALQKLINPNALGNFGILLQAKNVAVAVEKLSGFAMRI
jgi:SAM-dependent MidA family methyltransferase